MQGAADRVGWVPLVPHEYATVFCRASSRRAEEQPDLEYIDDGRGTWRVGDNAGPRCRCRQELVISLHYLDRRENSHISGGRE